VQARKQAAAIRGQKESAATPSGKCLPWALPESSSQGRSFTGQRRFTISAAQGGASQQGAC
jgi:hypothetical protein